MATRREQILAAALTALNGAGKPTGFTAERSRSRPTTRAQLPFGNVFVASESVDYESVTPQVRRTLDWGVAIFEVAKNADGEVSETVLDPLHLWVTESVLADPTFGGLAEYTYEQGTQWEMDEAEVVMATATITFQTVYVTHEADQESAG